MTTAAVEPPNLLPGAIVHIHGRPFVVDSLSVQFPGDGREVTGSLDLRACPLPPPPEPKRKPALGEVWRHGDIGSLYLVAGHHLRGFYGLNLGGGSWGVGGRWAEPTKLAEDVFGTDSIVFYADTPKAAFDRLVRES